MKLLVLVLKRLHPEGLQGEPCHRNPNVVIARYGKIVPVVIRVFTEIAES
jgi:hypothetical protein